MAIIELLTADLRLALLLVGAVLLMGIVVWEILQRRRASQADAAHQAGPPAIDPLLQPDETSDVREDPSLTLPEMHVRDRLIEPTLVDFDAAIAKEPSLGIPVLDSVTLSDPVGVAASSVQPAVAESRAHEPVTMRLDWPPPEQQRIIGVRVIARNGERFTGVSLRQALLGEGFQHGELEIFHRPMSDGRVLLSAASLTKPGNFDLATMDSGLFLGLNLFAVLPGPLPGRDTVDKLLIAGHTLAQRLRGELRDARGEALTEARLTEMRREAAAGDG
jgi:cell division protein ZipA